MTTAPTTASALTTTPGAGLHQRGRRLTSDGDGLVSCADPDCADDSDCFEIICTDGLDDDGDDLIDSEDPDCQAPGLVCTGSSSYYEE